MRLYIPGLVIVCIFSFYSNLPAQQAKPKAAPAKPEVPTRPDYPLDKLTQFSATMVGSPIGNIDELKIYRSGNLMRTQMLDGNYMVNDLEGHQTFVVLPNRCLVDSRLSINTFPFSAVHPGSKVERSPAGTETVDGHACQVEDITVTPEHGQPLRMRLWEANDLSGFPIKIEVQRAASPATITYKDVKIGKPDPALFVRPANCSKAPPPPKADVKLAPKSSAVPPK
jgi:hypothetical protein